MFSALNLSVGYTGSRGKDMFLRGVANTFDNTTRQRQSPSVGQVDYKTSGCVDGLVINGNALSGCGRASYDALQIGLTRRFRSGLSGGLQYQYSRNEGTTQGSNEAATASNTFDYNTEFGTNPTDLPHSFNGSLVYMLPFNGPIDRRLARRRHPERPVRRAHQRHDCATRHGPGGRRHRHQYSRRQLARHAAAGSRPRREPVSEGRRALVEPGGVRRADARHVRQPARATSCAGRTSGSST